MSYFTVVDSSAKTRGKWGNYRNVAVLEMQDGAPEPCMISERSRGCIRVVDTWLSVSVGRTERCAYRRALHEATALAERLNREAAESYAAIPPRLASTPTAAPPAVYCLDATQHALLLTALRDLGTADADSVAHMLSIWPAEIDGGYRIALARDAATIVAFAAAKVGAGLSPALTEIDAAALARIAA
jgi:hypothetical protein